MVGAFSKKNHTPAADIVRTAETPTAQRISGLQKLHMKYTQPQHSPNERSPKNEVPFQVGKISLKESFLKRFSDPNTMV